MRNIGQPLRMAHDQYATGHPPNCHRNPQDKNQRYEDKQLYELCQQLTRENRHLKREVSNLRKLVTDNQSSPPEALLYTQQQENYREINYECYKKKALQLLTSLKFLQNLYTEKSSLEKRDKILDSFMGKIKHGNSNHIQELLKLYNDSLNEQEADGWNLDQLEQQSSQYQNNILRTHIAKLNAIMLQTVRSLKSNLNDVKRDIIQNQGKMNEEIKYYCEKYLLEKSSTEPQPKKQKKKQKPSKDEKDIEKVSWDKIVGQRSKIKQQKFEPNVKEKIHQSLVIVESEQSSTIPLSSLDRNKPSIPKPQSRCKKQEITIIDELQHSKYIGGSSLTPHSVDRSRQQFKNSCDYSSMRQCSDMPSNKKSQKESPRRKYSYLR